jgi:hypothetical protein
MFSSHRISNLIKTGQFDKTIIAGLIKNIIVLFQAARIKMPTKGVHPLCLVTAKGISRQKDRP